MVERRKPQFWQDAGFYFAILLFGFVLMIFVAINYSRLLVILLWFGGGLVLFRLAGYAPFMFLFTFFFLRFFASCKTLLSLEIAAALSLITWLVFTVLLNIAPVGLR